MKGLHFKSRSTDPEILDDFDLQGHDLSVNLRELGQVNYLLGGYRILRIGMEKLVARRKLAGEAFHVADLGCGGGDNLLYLARLARRKKWQVRFTGIDTNLGAVAYARRLTREYPEIEIISGNIFDNLEQRLKADIFTFNLVLHHFSDEEIMQLMTRYSQNNSSLLINDLHRSKLAYFLFRPVSRTLGFSYIGRNDGLLSIKKSFTPADWRDLLTKAGINEHELSWRWAFRYLVLIY